MKEENWDEVFFSDTTLRDGEQMPGAALDPEQKVRIAHALVGAGVHSIEAGFPSSSPAEIKGVRRVAEEVCPAITLALARAAKQDIAAVQDAFSGTPRHRCGVCIFLATSPIHREQKLRKSKAEILEMIRTAIHFARQKLAIVSFSPEDASRTELDFLIAVYRTAIASGASGVGFPDTLGILTPEKTEDVFRALFEQLPELRTVPMAAHFHNDLGLATANTLAAVKAGVKIVQCTVNGIGERAGNAPLEEVAMALKLNADQYRRRISIRTEKLFSLSRLVEAETSIRCSPHKPVVGTNVFATEAGIHQDGLLKHPDTYLPFRPEAVGAPPIKLVLGKHSGRSAVQFRLRAMGLELSAPEIDLVMQYIKSSAKTDWEEDSVLSKAVHAALSKQLPPGSTSLAD